MPRTITVTKRRFPGDPALETGVSQAVLEAVGAHRLGETLRLHRTDRVVAFGRQDRAAANYPQAVAAAQAQGFAAVERLAGGRAAVFHEGTLAFAWAIPSEDPRAGVQQRFADIAGIVAEALTSLGVDARVGEVPGEYCPGSYSVNAAGRRKLMGTGQRLIRRAAHVGGVVVVSGGRLVAQVLIPVYRELGVSFDPGTCGDVAAEVPGVTLDQVEEGMLAAFARRYTLVEGDLEPQVVERGRELAATHRLSPAAAAPAG